MTIVKKISFSLLLMLLGTVLVNGFAQTHPQVTPNQKLQIAEYAISHYYVDKVDENKLVESAIIKMLEQLDPHSTYASPEEVKAFNEPLMGNFEGIGVQFQMMNDTLNVIQAVSGGPSEKVGILPGDRIISVNGKTIAGVKMPTSDIMKLLRGPKGSIAHLLIVRRGNIEPLAFDVVRDKIPLKSVDAAYMLTPTIGYIKVDRFAMETGNEFLQALDELKKKGMKDLVLDLQGNGGGLLKAAIDIADQFLHKGDLIVYTQGRVMPSDRFTAKGDGKFQNGRLVVLVNEFSASASEIVSGAIQDWDRGVLIGRRSFGKGLVQRPLDLPDGSMIRLTVARYYTPSGRCIQKPYSKNDANMQQEYDNDIVNRVKHGELIHADSIHFADSLKVSTKRLKRTVYGGGGIMPDVFVPVDTTGVTPYYRRVLDKGVIIKTVTSYVDNHRAELKKLYPIFSIFNKRFEVNVEILSLLNKEAETAGVKFNGQEYLTSLPLIKLQIKALIARNIWGMNEFYTIWSVLNSPLQQAKMILENGTYEKILKKRV